MTSEDIQEQFLDYKSLTDLNHISDINGLQEKDLSKLLSNIELNVSVLSKENEVYKNILKEHEALLTDSVISEIGAVKETNDVLTTDEKCYLAKKRLKNLEENLEHITSTNTSELKELKFKLESLDTTLNTLKESIEYYNKDVLEKHPVTKKYILQKLHKYLYESVKNKKAMGNRFKIQIQSFTMDYNKVLNQVKDQNKRLASLEVVKYQELKYKHQQVSKILAQHKKSLIKSKSKYSSIVQNMIEIEKALVEEDDKLNEINETLAKKEHLKSVMLSEKSYNDEKLKELNEAMRKIKLDPRRHDLPEIIEYAAVKRKNENLKKNIKLWQKKVEVAEQAKLMHLKALQKKKIE